MSFLGRLFGRPAAPAPPVPVAPPPPAVTANTVVVPQDLAAALTAGGQSLSDAVVSALREHLAERARDPAAPDAATPAADAPPAPSPPSPAATAPAGDRVPFWLAREEREPAIEDALRGKLERRRAAEGERAKGQPADAPED